MSRFFSNSFSVRCIVYFVGASREIWVFRLAICAQQKTTLRLFRPKTLFVIMLRRQNACERSASLFSDEMLAWKNSYRTSRHRQTRKQCFLWVCLCVLPCVLPKNRRCSLDTLTRIHTHTHSAEIRPAHTQFSMWAPVFIRRWCAELMN